MIFGEHPAHIGKQLISTSPSEPGLAAAWSELPQTANNSRSWCGLAATFVKTICADACASQFCASEWAWVNGFGAADSTHNHLNQIRTAQVQAQHEIVLPAPPMKFTIHFPIIND